MPDLSSLLERADRAVSGVPLPSGGVERLRSLRDRRHRNQRIAAGFVGIAVFLAAVLVVSTGWPFDRTRTPAAPGPTETEPIVSAVDFVLDLNTGAMTPLPEAILGSVGETAQDRDPGSQFAASPGGSQLAYVGTGDDGSRQIFIAGIDGSGVRQVTYDPTGAGWPAWSPDGTKIAYEGGAVGGSRYLRNLFVLDVATSESAKIVGAVSIGSGVQFTPDGSALVYTGGSGSAPELRTIPVAGGESTLLIVPDQGLNDSGAGSLSPDGSLVTFVGSGYPISGDPTIHCGPCRMVANADGTERRLIPGYGASPAGTWSPDGSRIVDLTCHGTPESHENCSLPDAIIVADIATGDASQLLALGVGAIWINDHTLLIDV